MLRAGMEFIWIEAGGSFSSAERQLRAWCGVSHPFTLTFYRLKA